MPRNYELDSLKSREQDAFQYKQTAFQRYAEARDRCSEAYNVMQAAWEERNSAKEEMNREWKEMRKASENYREVWDEYGRIRDRNNDEIERLRVEADCEHREMIDCFDRAGDCYEYGDKSEAPYWSSQGHDHKDRRNSINEEVSRLCQEVKSARQDAEWRAPKTDSSAFHEAKDVFERAKSRHESAQAEFKRLKSERDRLKSVFDSLQADYLRLKEEFQRKLEEIKSTNEREREKTLDKAGVRWSERGDAKIVKKADGTTQVYHGGFGRGDGLGHGHTALDRFGNKTYDREAFAEHGHQNFTDDNVNACKTLAVGTDMFDGKPAKVRHRKDGRTDIFFTNSGNYGDSLGHGHVVLAKDGHVTYYRDQWQDKKQGQYLVDESKDDHTKI